jgi:3-oxoacyl-[acyl-carrier protein] reductase
MRDEQWRHVLATNLDGAFYVTKRTIGDLVKKRAGSVIFVSSVSPFLGVPGQANYAASKAGLVGLARSLAGEVARRGVTVNVIAPGLIDTDMTKDLASAKDALLERVPLGRMGQTSDVAGVAVFLASDSARYITGAVLPVDGGLAMGL